MSSDLSRDCLNFVFFFMLSIFSFDSLCVYKATSIVLPSDVMSLGILFICLLIQEYETTR